MSQWIVGAFLLESEINDHPFDVEDYQRSYFELAQEIALLGGAMVVVRGDESYLGGGVFARAWKITSPGVFEDLGQTHVDVVFDKGKFKNDGLVAQFNHPDINLICTDKFVLYERLTPFCPQTTLATNQQEYLSALQTIKTELVVSKPQFGYEGNGVMIASAAELATQAPEFPVLIQEFIDTSRGIPGLAQSHHDLRVAIFDGEVLYSYVRTPPPGKLTANVSQGGTFVMVDPNKLPDSVLTIVKSIDEKLAYVGSRFYGVDFGITPQGPKIIEMNSRLGLLPNSDSPAFHTLKQKLAKAFEQLA